MRRLVIPVLVLAAVVASSCGGWRPDDAARVDGVEIDAGQLQSDTRRLLEQPAVADVLLGTGISSAGGDPGAGRLPTAALSGLLDRRIVEVLARRELAGRGIALGEADLSAAGQAVRDELTARQGQAQAGQPDPVAAYESLPADLRARLAGADAAVIRLRTELAAEELRAFPADARAWFRDNDDQFERYCLSVLPVTDEATGRRLAAESASGVPLADLVSRQGGQEAGCGLGYQLAESFAPDLADALVNAPPGRAVGPFPATDGSLVLVGLTSRTPQSFESVDAAPETAGVPDELYRRARQAVEDGPWQEWRAGQRPKVTVDPRYGTWDAETLSVLPPQGGAPRGGLAP